MSQEQAMELLRAGVQCANAGNKAQARELIRKSVQLHPTLEMGWLWLAGIGETPQEVYSAIQKTLELNPANESALQRINPARLRAGIDWIKAGQKAQGARLLRDSVKAEPQNEVAWLWLASATENAEEAFNSLKKVLEINPANEQARSGLEHYRSKLAPAAAPKPAPKPAAAPAAKPAPASVPVAATAPTAKPIWQCPFCSFSAATKHSTCPNCSSMLVLNSIDALLANRAIQEDKVKPGLDRLAARAKTKPDFSLHYYLAIGYLQLRRIDETLGHFRAALQIQNHDAIRRHLEALEQHQRSTVQTVSATATGVGSRPKTIFIVDDSITVRKLVSMTVNELGYRVIEAADGIEALDRIRTDGVPDLMFLDIMMPGMDGYTLCKELRSAKQTANLPIVMLSGKDGTFNKMRGRMVGSTHYLTKPFVADSLIQVIQQYCKPESAEAAHT